jgi:hypothetical protein
MVKAQMEPVHLQVKVVRHFQHFQLAQLYGA